MVDLVITNNSDLLSLANEGIPEAIFELAQRYGAGLFGDNQDEKYIFWLGKFLSSEIIRSILDELDDDDTEAIGLKSNTWNIEYLEYYPLIVEAGMDIGLYYFNSNDINQLEYARDSIYSAWLASKFDFIEAETMDGQKDLVGILADLTARIEQIKGGQK